MAAATLPSLVWMRSPSLTFHSTLICQSNALQNNPEGQPVSFKHATEGDIGDDTHVHSSCWNTSSKKGTPATTPGLLHQRVAVFVSSPTT